MDGVDRRPVLNLVPLAATASFDAALDTIEASLQRYRDVVMDALSAPGAQTREVLWDAITDDYEPRAQVLSEVLTRLIDMLQSSWPEAPCAPDPFRPLAQPDGVHEGIGRGDVGGSVIAAGSGGIHPTGADHEVARASPPRDQSGSQSPRGADETREVWAQETHRPEGRGSTPFYCQGRSAPDSYFD